MRSPPEPFFTADERETLTLFRPRAWARWWRREPVSTKVIGFILVILLAVGLYALATGEKVVGWTLVGSVLALLGLLLLVGVATVLFASVRWALRVTGVAAAWRTIRSAVITTLAIAFWAGLVVLVLVALSPYLSSDPVKTWYAITLRVPADQVMIEKKPHDCEFQTAPLGNKNCHYEAHATTIKGSDSPDGKPYAFVGYQKVAD